MLVKVTDMEALVTRNFVNAMDEWSPVNMPMLCQCCEIMIGHLKKGTILERDLVRYNIAQS